MRFDSRMVDPLPAFSMRILEGGRYLEPPSVSRHDDCAPFRPAAEPVGGWLQCLPARQGPHMQHTRRWPTALHVRKFDGPVFCRHLPPGPGCPEADRRVPVDPALQRARLDGLSLQLQVSGGCDPRLHHCTLAAQCTHAQLGANSLRMTTPSASCARAHTRTAPALAPFYYELAVIVRSYFTKVAG